jgi:alanine transaminase
MENTAQFLSLRTMNQGLVKAENAVTGVMSQTALKIRGELANGTGNYPFKEITPLNIGNPQALGQPPLTFNRQVLSILLYPELLKSDMIPEGAKKRARYYLERIPGSIGAYGPAPGYVFVRENIAKFLAKRDGAASSADHIQMMDGSADGVIDVISAHVSGSDSGFMIPIPQYPLYSGSIAYVGGTEVPYYLDEETGWQVTIEHLEKAHKEATAKGIKVKGIVVINPGNPTGQILNEETMKEFIKFAYDRGMSLLADEVYQDNVWTKPWFSFRKVVASMDAPYNRLPVYSINSCSKGFYGECGLRGGYIEFFNVDPDVEAQIKKITTLSLSVNTIGQITMDMIANPPTEEENGKEVYEQYEKEKAEILGTMKKNAEIATRVFNSMKNVTVQPAEGAVYAFPRVELSQKAIDEAQKRGLAPDLLYTLEGLQATGMVLVEGSGFRQKAGTYHFRTTILVRPSEKFEEKLLAYKKFNDDFHAKYE